MPDGGVKVEVPKPAAVGAGLDLTAVETSTTATVKAAQWLLGTAGAIVPIVVGGVQITRLNDALARPLTLALSLGALAVATAAVCVVLARATSVLKVPYADLSEVSDIRNQHLRGGKWDDVNAQADWGRANQVTSAATGGELPEVSVLHDEIQGLRASAEEQDKKRLVELEQVARVVVAVLNRREIERRFETLKNSYMWAAVFVVASVAVFVAASTAPRGLVAEPVSVRLMPSGDEWPEALGDCGAEELLGAAVGGAWPRPDVVVLAEDSCAPALVDNSEGLTVVPIADDNLKAEDDPDPLAISAPTAVMVYRVEATWPTPALAGCKAKKLKGTAIGGSWSAPDVVTARRKDSCPPSLIQDGVGFLAVPRDDGPTAAEPKGKGDPNSVETEGRAGS